MENQSAPLDELSQRFAKRLDAALDAMGYPAKQLDRRKELAYALSVEISVSTTLLSGFSLPNYEQLLALCSLTNREPGYFLNRQLPVFPDATTVVKPLGPGEDLVVKLPKDMLSPDEAAKGLVYLRARVPTYGYGIEAGDYLIALRPSERPKPRAQRLYLFQGSREYSVRRCTEVSGARAVFHEDANPDVSFVVSTPVRMATEEVEPFSQLVASLRGGKQLHLHT